MGLFSRGEKVRGVAQIVSTTAPPHAATSGTCRMQVVVSAEGVPAVHVDATRICRVSKWPSPGMTLPCELDPRKPEDFKILWDEMPSWQDQARQQAAMLAQQMNAQQAGGGFSGGAPGGMPFIPPGAQVQIVTADGGPPDPAKLAKVEQMLGRDLDGDGGIGTVGGAAPGATSAPPPPPGAPPVPAGAPDNRIAALERLAALRSQGILTEAEFAAEKQRILNS